MSFSVEETGALHVENPTYKIGCPNCDNVIAVGNATTVLFRHVTVCAIDLEKNHATARCKCRKTVRIKDKQVTIIE